MCVTRGPTKNQCNGTFFALSLLQRLFVLHFHFSFYFFSALKFQMKSGQICNWSSPQLDHRPFLIACALMGNSHSETSSRFQEWNCSSFKFSKCGNRMKQEIKIKWYLFSIKTVLQMVHIHRMENWDKYITFVFKQTHMFWVPFFVVVVFISKVLPCMACCHQLPICFHLDVDK